MIRRTSTGTLHLHSQYPTLSISRTSTSQKRLLHLSLFNCAQEKPSSLKTELQEKEQPSIDFCYTRVRTLDYPGFYSTLYLPKPQRDAVIALRAFNIQTATIKDVISKPEIGEMRVIWWRDTIKKIYEKKEVPLDPVVQEVARAINSYKLTQTFFLKCLNARYKDLKVKQPESLEDVEEYCENTSSSLLYLTLEVMGVKNQNADHAASHIGKAIGMVTLLRGFSHHLRNRELYIPVELTVKHNISQEQIFRQEINDNVLEAVYEFANRAINHLEWGRSFMKKVPTKARPVFLSAAFADDFLYTLQKNAYFDPLHPSLFEYSIKPKLHIVKNYYLNKY